MVAQVATLTQSQRGRTCAKTPCKAAYNASKGSRPASLLTSQGRNSYHSLNAKSPRRQPGALASQAAGVRLAARSYRLASCSFDTKTMAQAKLVSYRIENFPELVPLLAKAQEQMSAKQKAEIIRAIDNGDDGFSRAFQLEAPSSECQRTYTLGELADSYLNEEHYQRLNVAPIESVLFERLGMIRRTGGGSPMRLQRDPLIGFIVRKSENVEIGPIIAGGRHRLMALQIMLRAAAPSANIDSLAIRCMTRFFRNRDELVRAVFADQEGRVMARAEKREREATGLNMTSREGLAASLGQLKRDDYGTALGGFVKLCAIENGLDDLTLDQFAAAGVTAYNILKKENKGLNQKVHDTDGTMLVQLGDASCRVLTSLLPSVMADRSKGPKNSKLAKALARTIAVQTNLICTA